MKYWIMLLSVLPLAAFAENTVKNSANEISKHYFAQPSFYQLDSISKEQSQIKLRVNM